MVFNTRRRCYSMRTRTSIRFVLSLFLLIGAFAFLFSGKPACAKTIKLNKKTIYLAPGMKYKLKVIGTKKQVKWKSNKKKIVTVGKKGKITAKKPGKAVIIAKVKGKKLKCKVIVEKRTKYNLRKLRDYVVKHGKKYKDGDGIPYYVITNTDIDEEQTEYKASISAYKTKTEMEFSYRILPDTTAGSDVSYLLRIDLFNKTYGRFDRYSFDCADNSGFTAWGKFTTAFDGKGAGVTVKGYYDVDSEGGETARENPGSYSANMSKDYATAFKALDRLLKVKKTGVKMNTIGFSKWK